MGRKRATPHDADIVSMPFDDFGSQGGPRFTVARELGHRGHPDQPLSSLKIEILDDSAQCVSNDRDGIRRMEPEMKCCRSSPRLLDEEPDLVEIIVVVRDPEIHALVEPIDTR